MADFALLGEAMFRYLGKPSGKFVEIYAEHRRNATWRSIDASPVAAACLRFISAGKEHNGTVGELFDKFMEISWGEGLERGEQLPRTARGLGEALRRVAPALRALGLDVSSTHHRVSNGYRCTLRRGTFKGLSSVDVSQ